jgi:rhomboid protease GluP
MDLNGTVLGLAVMTCGIVLWRCVRDRSWSGWGTVAASLLAALGLLYWLVPEQAGLLIAGPWCLLLMVPLVGNAALHRQISQHKYQRAFRLAQLLAWLHPADGFWQQPRLIRALELLHLGQTAAAQTELQSLGQIRSPLYRVAQVLQVRQSDDWGQTLAWLTAHGPLQPQNDPLLIDLYLQALGETGQFPELLEEYARLCQAPEQKAQGLQQKLFRLRAAMYCGQVDLVEQLLRGSLGQTARETCDFWRATALEAAGRLTEARALYAQLEQVTDQSLARRVQGRLAQPLPRFELATLAPPQVAILERLRREIWHDAQFAVMNNLGQRPAPATLLLVCCLILVYLTELSGDPTDSLFLIERGALVLPSRVTPGESYRYVTAAFLHAGALHLLLNLFGLQWFGKRLEQAWGSLPMLVCFLVTAIGSMLLFEPVLTTLGYDLEAQPVVLVGASGGVMGLIGAISGHLLIGVWQQRSQQVSAEFSVLATILLLQTLSDSQSPQVSGTVHLTGAALGLLIGMAYAGCITSRSRKYVMRGE